MAPGCNIHVTSGDDDDDDADADDGDDRLGARAPFRRDGGGPAPQDGDGRNLYNAKEVNDQVFEDLLLLPSRFELRGWRLELRGPSRGSKA